MRILVLLFLLICTQLNAQHVDPYGIDKIQPNSEFGSMEALDANVNSVKAFAVRHFPEVNSVDDLKLIYIKESPIGHHFYFRQLHNGRLIFKSFLKISINKRGRVYLTASILYSDKILDAQLSQTEIDQFYILKERYPQFFEPDSIIAEQVLFPIENGMKQAVSYQLTRSDLSMQIVIDENGNELYKEDLTRYYSQGKDSLVNALVFLPDPLTTAGVVYGTPYKDYNDSNLAILNNEMVNVNVIADYDNGVFSLENDFVKMTNYKNSNYIPATSTSPTFYYNRAEQEFEDINVFYHISTYQEYIQSLGFNNLANYQIHTESHAYPTDNSTYVSSHNPPRINYGEGGVDDGEDADVIIHEYGHALEYDAAPGSVSGFERKSISEGVCDYFAVSYSRSLNDFNWEYVFSWDGHNEFYPGRMAKSNKIYPNDMQSVSYHDNADIWSSTLMEIWEVIGQQKTDEIVFQSLYDYFANMSMSEAAMTVIMADSNLNNGANYYNICDAFNRRGFSTICNGFSGITQESKNSSIQLLNSYGFRFGEPLTLKIPGVYNKIEIKMHSLNGSTVYSERVDKIEGRLNIDPKGLENGMYILQISSPQFGTERFKVVRSNVK